jgi:hypothetical protein
MQRTKRTIGRYASSPALKLGEAQLCGGVLRRVRCTRGQVEKLMRPLFMSPTETKGGQAVLVGGARVQMCSTITRRDAHQRAAQAVEEAADEQPAKRRSTKGEPRTAGEGSGRTLAETPPMAVQPRGRLSSFFSLPAAKLASTTPFGGESPAALGAGETATPSRMTPMAMTPQVRYGGSAGPPSLPRFGGRPSLAMSPFTLRRASGVSQGSDGDGDGPASSSNFLQGLDLFSLSDYDHPIYTQADDWLVARGRLAASSPVSAKENRHMGGTTGANKAGVDGKGVEARLLRGAMGKDGAAFSPGLAVFSGLIASPAKLGKEVGGEALGCSEAAVPTTGQAFSPSNFLKELR